MTYTSSVHVVPIEPKLARDLAGAARRLAEWRAKRDGFIWDAHQNGASLREIAAQVDLSNPGVLSILRREAERRDGPADDPTTSFTTKDGEQVTIQPKTYPPDDLP